MPAMLALVAGLDVISAVLLVGQFRQDGDRRALVLASAYVYSLIVGIGFGAAFPGIMGAVGPLGGWPSTAPWLWATWHTGFPVLLAAGAGPWPRAWTRPVSAPRRAMTAWVSLAAVVLVGALMIVTAAHGRGWLPALIDGLDTGGLTRIAGPVMLPVIIVATLVAVKGALGLSGPARWASLAAAAVLGDAALTLLSRTRFSLGWYVGRSLMVVASGVVLVAMLAEFARLRGQLAVEGDRLRVLLSRSEELEALRSTLLNLMSDGVMLRDADGRVVAANPAAEALLGLSNDQLYGRASMPAEWDVLRSDGTTWPAEQVPDRVTLMTGVALHDQMLGVPRVGGGRRWLRVNTAAARDDREGAVQYVVSSLTDETPRHTALLAAGWERDSKRIRTQAVLDAGGPQIVVQAIVDLRSGAVVGGEALSRFSGQPVQGPDKWFADAADVGMGTELELAAVRGALDVLRMTPQDRYLSVNVSPATATSSAFFELLAGAEASSRQLVLELTEHEGVSDYAALRTALAPLRARGVRLAVDDAGAGYASLSHILNLRPDIVKLDISLVRDIHGDPARRALVAGLLTFAQEIGACLVAEGIETAHELAALRAVGVTHGQGYYLGCPAPMPQDLVDVPQQAGPLQAVGR